MVQYPMTTFLGSYIPPEALTLSAVKEPAPAASFEAAIANANILAPGIQGDAAIP